MNKNRTKRIADLIVSPLGMASFCALSVVAALLLREPQRPVAPNVKIALLPSIPLVAETPLAVEPPLYHPPVVEKPVKRVVVRKAPIRKQALRKASAVHYTGNWKSKNNPLARSIQKREWAARNQFVDSELASDFAVDATIVNGNEPELAALDEALENSEGEPSDFTQPKISAAQMDTELLLRVPAVDEVPYVETVGTIVKNDFSELRASLAQLKDSSLLTEKKPTEKAPEIVRPTKRTIARKKEIQKPARLKGREANADWVAKAQIPALPPAESLPGEEVPAPPQPVLDASKEFALLVPETMGPPVPEAVNSVVALPAPVAPPATVAAPKVAMTVSPALAMVETPKDLLSSLPQRRVSTAEKTVSTQESPKTRATLPLPIAVDPYAGFEQKAFDTDFFGRVSQSGDFKAWLNQNKAHVEYYLQPVKNRDPQGTRYLSFKYPQDSFREAAKALKGRYELVAGVFRPQDIDTPYAEIVHPEEINAATAHQHIKFHLDPRNFRVLAHDDASPGRRSVKIFLSLFKGASPDYETPEPIPFAEARLVGFPNLGVFHGDAEGNLVIPKYPSHSPAIVEVRSKGFHRTFRTIPGFGGDIHSPIYQVSLKQTQTLLSTIVGVKQAAQLSMTLGRAFDSETRNLLEGERIDLADQPPQNGHYFRFFTLGTDLLSRLTTSTGFFSDFNIASAFRRWLRPEPEKRPFRLFVQPSSAYYVELGRGGERSFLGRLVDGNGAPISHARIRLAEDNGYEAQSDAEGKFEIPGIDFQSGVIAMDVVADGYRLTRHTVPWNPRQSAHYRDLLMVKRTFVENAIAAHLGNLPEGGNVIAGTFGGLLESIQGCLKLELFSVATNEIVSAEHGPFPLLGGDSGSVCIRTGQPAAIYRGLPSGEYLLKSVAENGEELGARVIHTHVNGDAISIN